MGYAQAPKLIAESEEVGGTLFMVPQFKSIAKTTYNIQDIKLDPAYATPWADFITTISQAGDGDTIQSYYYVLDYDPMGDGNTITGWLADDGISLADIEIKPGECVIVDLCQPCAITTSGEVASGSVSSFVMDDAGAYFIGNACPVEKDIQEFKLDSATAIPWADFITTISLAGDGDTIQSYYYVQDYDPMGDGNTITGWLAEDGISLQVLPVKPGEGLIINVNQATSVELPNAL